MPLREEGVSLRFGADIAGLRAGKREIQEWSKEVERLSTLVKKGLATPQDISRLRDFQDTAKRGYDALETKLQSYQERREQYLSQVGVAPTAQARLRAMGGAKAAQEVQYQAVRQQEALRRLGEAAAPPAPPAPGRGGAITGALGMARRIPGVGAALTGAGMAAMAFAGGRRAYQEYVDIEISATNTALAYQRGIVSVKAMTQEMRALGREASFTQKQSVEAARALTAAGGGAMMRGPVGREAMQWARYRGIAPEQLLGLTGAFGRVGAVTPTDQRFMATVEGFRLQSGRNPLALQQYMQTVLPFLQSEGRFQPFTQKSIIAFGGLQAAMRPRAEFAGGALTPEQQRREEFIRRNMPGIAMGLAQGIRAPQGPAAQFAVMRAMGLGEPGVSFYEVRRRMQMGLTPENIRRVMGGFRGAGQEEFGFAMETMFGLSFEQAEALRKAVRRPGFEGQFNAEEARKLGAKTLRDLKEKLGATDVEKLFDIEAELSDMRRKIGEHIAPAVIEIKDKFAQVADGFIRFFGLDGEGVPSGPPMTYRGMARQLMEADLVSAAHAMYPEEGMAPTE